nr:MAG TPA: hypothetical protein [Caudoviricetes sp.]
MRVAIPAAGKRGRKLRVAPEGSDLSSAWLKKSETVDYVRRRSI